MDYREEIIVPFNLKKKTSRYKARKINYIVEILRENFLSFNLKKKNIYR